MLSFGPLAQGAIASSAPALGGDGGGGGAGIVPSSSYRKIMLGVAFQTVRGSNNEIGFGSRSFVETTDTAAFGAFAQTKYSNYTFGWKVEGFSFSMLSRSGGPTVEAYLGVAYGNGLGIHRPGLNWESLYLGEIAIYAGENVKDVFDGNIAPLAVFEFNSATRQVENTSPNPHYRYVIEDCGVTDPTTIFTSGQPYMLELRFNQSVFNADSTYPYFSYPNLLIDALADPYSLEVKPNKGSIFAGRGNDIEVQILYKKKPLDLQQFDTFHLTVGGVVIDTSQPGQENAVKFGSKGTLILDCGPYLSTVGETSTTLLAFSAQHPSGVVLWDENLANANFKINVLAL